MRRILVIGALAALAALAACAPPAHQAPAASDEPAAKPIPVKSDAPAGEYKLDLAHASLNFRIVHMGLSHYTARFTKFDATLKFDPGDPEGMSVTATIDPHSIQTNYPDPKKTDFDKELQNDKLLDTAKFPLMTYKSTAVELTGPNTANVTGDLTLHGVTAPVDLDVTFNGGYAPSATDPAARIGFSAHGSLTRSAFGMGYGVPPPGSAVGVGDDVEIIIETEFAKAGPAPPAAPAPH